MLETVLKRIFRTLQRIEAGFLAYAIITVALLSIVNVFFRTVLNSSLSFAEELAQFLMVYITFIGLSYGASKGRHIRMSALYDQMSLPTRKLLMVIISATTALLLLFFAYYAFGYVSTVYTLGTRSAALGVPLYLVYGAAPLGLSLASLQFALTAVQNLRSSDVYLSFETKDEYEAQEDAEIASATASQVG